MEACSRLTEFMHSQRVVIERHIDEHKWLQGIPDKDVAIGDFIKKYGWIMRETFCSACPDRTRCGYYETHFRENSESDREYVLTIMSL